MAQIIITARAGALASTTIQHMHTHANAFNAPPSPPMCAHSGCVCVCKSKGGRTGPCRSTHIYYAHSGKKNATRPLRSENAFPIHKSTSTHI